MNPKESDWKLYSSLISGWRERYLQKVLTAAVQVINDDTHSATEKFWLCEKHFNDHQRVLRLCFDPFSRSKMYLKLHNMLNYEIINLADLASFSQYLQNYFKNRITY